MFGAGLSQILFRCVRVFSMREDVALLASNALEYACRDGEPNNTITTTIVSPNFALSEVGRILLATSGLDIECIAIIATRPPPALMMFSLTIMSTLATECKQSSLHHHNCHVATITHHSTNKHQRHARIEIAIMVTIIIPILSLLVPPLSSTSDTIAITFT